MCLWHIIFYYAVSPPPPPFALANESKHNSSAKNYKADFWANVNVFTVGSTKENHSFRFNFKGANEANLIARQM